MTRLLPHDLIRITLLILSPGSRWPYYCFPQAILSI